MNQRDRKNMMTGAGWALLALLVLGLALELM